MGARLDGEWWSPRDPPQQPQWAWVKASPLPPSPAFFLAPRVPTLLPSDTYIYIYIIYNIGLSRALSFLAHSIFYSRRQISVISFLSAMGGGDCLPGASLLDSSRDVGGAGWVMGDRASVAPARPSPGQGPRRAQSVWPPPPDKAVTGSPGRLGLQGQSHWASGVAGGPGHSGFGEAPRTLGSSPPLGSGGAGGPRGPGQR